MNSADQFFSLDGEYIPFLRGDTILTAARRAGRHIPSLCYHAKTGALSVCRICVVEVAGRDGLAPSCSTAASEGLVVRSDTRRVREARKTILELLFSRGDHECSRCPADGSCELQVAAQSAGVEPRSAGSDEPPDVSAPFIRRLPDKCILCGRCVAACSSTVMHKVLSFGGRGGMTRVICDHDVPMGRSSCVQCGECVQFCPTGALSDRPSGDPAPAAPGGETVATVCPYCGVGCGISLTVTDSRITEVQGTEGHPVSDGMLCAKGRYGLSFVASPERLTRPLLRCGDGRLHEATWREAIRYAAARIRRIVDDHGADAFAGLSSAKCTNEENYLFQKLFRGVIGTNNLDHCARLCHSSTVSAMAASIGSGAMTNSVADIGQADVILVIGSDTTAAHPVIASYIKRAVESNGTKLIVADPKGIGLAGHARLHIKHRPGTDVALVNGIARIIVREGLADLEFISRRCSGYERFAESLSEWTPGKVSRITGIPPSLIEEAALLFGSAPRGSVFYAMGITQHTTGTDNVRSLVNLQLLCGNFGRPGTGLNPLRGQCNVQGACDMGALPDLLPGYVSADDCAGRKRFEDAWEVSLPHTPGMKALDMIEAAARGSVKGMYIVGENPCLSDPDITRVASTLSGLEFLAVQDIFLTETAALADVVLPAACFAEKEGHFTNTERRVQRLRRALSPPGEALEDLVIFQRLAAALGSPWREQSARSIHDEIRLLVPSYRGITWNRKGTGGVQWPAPSYRHRGTAILHKDRFPSGRAPFSPLRHSPPAERTDDEYPFALTTGRLLHQFHTGTMTRKEPGLDRMAGPMALFSCKDAERLNIRPGDIVEIATRRGAIRAPASISQSLREGLIFVPFHFSESPANALTNPATDKVAGIPEFKVCAARARVVSRTDNET